VTVAGEMVDGEASALVGQWAELLAYNDPA
jgi:hypothetical protein